METETIKVQSCGVAGLHAQPVEVEIARSRGMVHFHIIGLPDSAVRESSHRVMTALTAFNLPIPSGPILVNLAPAATRKQGAALDLPIALGVTAADAGLPTTALRDTLIIGELGLDGTVKPVYSAFLAGCLARHMQLSRVLCPTSCAPEVALAVQGATQVWGVKNLGEAVALLCGREEPAPIPRRGVQDLCHPPLDLADVKGQERALRALEVAAAGAHHLLLQGPPGSGKSFLSMRLPGILPPLREEERVEVTRIRSAAGLSVASLAEERPFRAPHHTVSYAGLVGGGADPRPGEVTLAHRGVLFLDELPEFERRTLEVLRQPLEDGQVHLGRARVARIYPARFLLVAAMNPCPCGYQGHPTRPCRCPQSAVNKYRNRISGPLLDRFDIRIWVPPVEPWKLLPLSEAAPSPQVTSARVRARVARARRRQARRYRSEPFKTNGELPGSRLDRYAPLNLDLRKLLLEALESLALSARGLVRVRRVARTLADLEGTENIGEGHLLEALAGRSDPPA